MKKVTLILILVSLFINTAYNQSTIWLMNSDHISLTHFKIDTIHRTFKYNNKKGKEKIIPLDHIFSITDSLGNEHIYYRQHLQDSTSLSTEEMRNYLKGSDDAYKNYNNSLFTIGGFITGAGAGYTLAQFGLLPTAAYPVIVGLTNISEKKLKKKSPDVSNNPEYIKGYKEAGANKRTWNSIKSSFTGFATGLAISLITRL